MLYVFGGGNNDMMARLTRLQPPRDADSFPFLGGGFNAGWMPASRVRGHASITDGIGGPIFCSLEEIACLSGVEGRL